MKKKFQFALIIAALSLAGTGHAQTLLYQWNFDNGTTTTTTPNVTAGGGGLTLTDATGSGAAGNTVVFNPTGGPGAGGYGSAMGALVAMGQGYNSGNTAVGLGTLSGLGNLSSFTVSFWFYLGPSVANGFPRFVMVGTNATYDVGGGGTGNTAPGFGTSINGWTGSQFPATTLQNGVAGSLSATNESGSVGGANVFSNTWYFEAMTYDGTNLTTYLGTRNSNAVQVEKIGAAVGALNYGTNGTILIANYKTGAARAINNGSIADVRIYSGAQSLAQIQAVQTNAASSANLNPNMPVAGTPVISSSSIIFLGASITLTDSPTGAAPISYQWQTDGGSGGTLTNIPFATNSSLTTTPNKTGTFQYGVIVTNSFGSSTGAVVAAIVLPTPGTANVIVNVASNLFPVASTAYGMHTSTYDNQNGNSSLPAQLIQSGVNTLRYSGGGYADVFHWSVTRPGLGGANGYGYSPWQGGSYAYMGSQTDFGNFVKLLSNAQCQAVITVNWGSGLQWNAGHTSLIAPATNAEPPEAAAWVAYANSPTNIFGTASDVALGVDSLGNDWKTAGYWAMLRAASPLGTDDGYNFLRIGRKLPIGIKYWEIGNETFGTGYYSAGSDGYSVNYSVPYPNGTYTRYGNTNLSPATYGKGVKSFSQLMKAVDPTIKIGAAVVTPQTWDTYNNGPHWMSEVLGQCATNIDFVINHSYPYAGNYSDGTALLTSNNSYLQTMVNGTGNHSGLNAGLRDVINAYRTDGTNVQIFITEFAYVGSVTNSLNGEPIYGPVNGLLAADSYATWLELGVSNIDWLEMNKNTFLGDGNPLVRGATYYAIQLTHAMAAPGDIMVAATDDAVGLNVHAAVQQSGRIGVMLLNENLTNSLTVNVTIPNVNLASSGTMYQFGTNNFNSGSSTIPATGPTTNTVSVSGNSLSVGMPPYTMAVLTIATNAAAINTPPGLAVITNRTVNAGQTVAFTASATDTDAPPQALIFTLLAGATNATLNTNSGAFSWRSLVTQANSTNAFSLKVADNGTPSLSATQNFSVTVNPMTLPQFTNISMLNGKFNLQVNGQAGPDYEVQSSTNLTQWSAALITNSPAMPFNWTDANATNVPARFYRAVVGPPLP